MNAESACRLHLLVATISLNRHHLRVRVDLADNRERAPANFVVYPAKVFAKHAHAKKQHTSDEEHGGSHAESCGVEWILRKYRRDSEESCQANREAGQQETEPQRLVTEAGDCIHRVLDPAQERQLAFAACPVLPIIENDSIAVANPCS